MVGKVIAWGLPTEEAASITRTLVSAATQTELHPILTFRDRAVTELHSVHRLVMHTEDRFPNEELVQGTVRDIVGLCCCYESVGRNLIAAMLRCYEDDAQGHDDQGRDEETQRQHGEDREEQATEKPPHKKGIRQDREGGRSAVSWCPVVRA